MRKLIEKTVTENWLAGYDEGLHAAAYHMGYNVVQSPEEYNSDQWHVGGFHVVGREAGDAFAGLLDMLDDEALLKFLDGQLCLKYR